MSDQYPQCPVHLPMYRFAQLDASGYLYLYGRLIEVSELVTAYNRRMQEHTTVIEQFNAQVRKQEQALLYDAVEAYIRKLWGAPGSTTTDDEQTLIAGNIRAFAGHLAREVGIEQRWEVEASDE